MAIKHVKIYSRSGSAVATFMNGDHTRNPDSYSLSNAKQLMYSIDKLNSTAAVFGETMIISCEDDMKDRVLAKMKQVFTNFVVTIH